MVHDIGRCRAAAGRPRGVRRQCGATRRPNADRAASVPICRDGAGSRARSRRPRCDPPRDHIRSADGDRESSGEERRERQGRARGRRRDVVGDLLSRWRARRARLLRLRRPRPGAARDLRRGLLPALASPAADARRARRPAVAAGRGAAAARSHPAADAQPAAGGRHGRAAHAHVGVGPLRRRGQRFVAAGAVPQGGAAHGPDRHDRRHLGPAAGWRRTDRAGPGDEPFGQLPLHAHRGPSQRPGGEGLRHRADPARRSRAECVHLRGPRRRRHAHRHLLGRGRRDRHAEGPAPWRRQRRGDEDAARARRERRPATASTTS